MLNKSLKKSGRRYCNQCDTIKPAGDFNVGGGGPGCRECVNTYAENYRDKNRDAIKEKHKQYRQSDPQAWRDRSAKYREGGRDPDKPWPEGWCSYEAAHARPLRVYGPARNYMCCIEGCPNVAYDWAYNHQDQNEYQVPDRRTGSPLFYSGHHDYYQPMCRLCHKAFDTEHAKEKEK